MVLGFRGDFALVGDRVGRAADEVGSFSKCEELVLVSKNETALVDDLVRFERGSA